MAITTITVTRINPDRSQNDSDKETRRQEVQSYLVTLVGKGFSFFRRVEDPAFLCVFEQFESLDAAYVNAQSVKNISDCFSWVWMSNHEFCIDDVTADAERLELHNFVVKTGSRPEFEQQVKDSPGETTGDAGRLVSGWGVEQAGGSEVYVVVFAVDDVERKLALRKRFDR